MVDPLFNTDTLIVPQYLLLALFGWLAITTLQQGRNIQKLLTSMDNHIAEALQDKKRLSRLEDKLFEKI